MKHGGERKGSWGEGWLVAVALGLVLALSLAVYLVRIPPKVEVVPIRVVDFEELRRVEIVNINTASAENLSRLPGIGEVLAERIIAYREAHGPFTSVEELMRVEGIGEGKLDGIRNEIYLD